MLNKRIALLAIDARGGGLVRAKREAGGAAERFEFRRIVHLDRPSDRPGRAAWILSHEQPLSYILPSFASSSGVHGGRFILRREAARRPLECL